VDLESRREATQDLALARIELGVMTEELLDIGELAAQAAIEQEIE